ncbi:carbamoyltransferase [Candidatus Uabimicrobium sp. HlEnr_7]|uniref:carbamoyltransferase family protein n=1 Tax=Candidatus Uabimicrobium helgolandensis TaxID=3095367 RepID=UPI0035564EE8
MTYILGISGYYHDSAAALIKDGEIIAAAQEERFTRKKQDESFPKKAIEYCLSEAGINASQLDAVGFYDKPIVKFHRLLETYFAFAPAGFVSFSKALPLWLGLKLFIPREIRKNLSTFSGPILYADHHETHAASAFFPSPFDRAAILTIDGVGEWTTSSFGVGNGNKIELKKHLKFPHSLGLLYSAFTYYTGFKVNSGEYKVMGLAPYGDKENAKKYAQIIYDNLIDLKEDGSFRLNLDYFNYCQGLTMTNSRFAKLFGGPARKAEKEITQREMDLAAAVQEVVEEAMLRMAKHLRKETGEKNLCMAGGVALNCVGNGKIIKEGIFDKYFIQPAAGDAGGALGTALFLWYQFLDNKRKVNGKDDLQKASLLGPQFSNREVQRYLNGIGAKYTSYDSWDEQLDYLVELIEQGKVIGFFEGRMEFGPRALGSRSIIGDPRSTKMQSIMNLKIKFRESFRPFAPIVMEEHAQEYFDLKDPSPYMLRVGHVVENKRLKLTEEQQKLWGIEKLNIPRSDIPAVTHVDYSARVQTVDKVRHPVLHQLMSKFREKTGCAVFVNTSFNVRGEPIVCSPHDAFQCFLNTGMDVLVLEQQVLLKEEQTIKQKTKDYLAQFALD